MKSILIIITTFLFTSVNLENDNSWNLVQNENGIQVYNRLTNSSPIKELKATTFVNSTLSKTVHLIQNPQDFPSWVYMCSYAKVAKKVSDTNQFFYVYTDSPWPVTDRDMVVNGHLSQDPVTKTITIVSKSANQLVPEKVECVRIKNVYSKWVIIPVEENKLKLTYYLQMDIGGNIPVWLMNYSMHIGPYNTLLQMKEKLKTAPPIKLDFIID